MFHVEQVYIVCMMKIELTSQQSLRLARDFAQVIHGVMVAKNLKRSHGIWESCLDQNIWAQYRDSSFRDVQKAIRSLEGLERRDFLRALKFYLTVICQEKGTPRTWQAYVKAVRLAKRAHDLECERRVVA